MLKGRRVGTATTGLVLVATGVLFLLRLFNPHFDPALYFSLWPVILILLGIEILIAYAVNSQEKLKYDGGAIVILILMTLFSMALCGLDIAMQYYSIPFGKF